MEGRIYVAIDLKTFYASVECVERGLDPLTTNLVVADESRTEKTICLAVTPSLKAYGIPGRARLFEVVQKVAEANAKRIRSAPGRAFTGASSDSTELASRPELKIDYIVAVPQMAHYLQCATQIYDIYLKYIAPEDIHVYSIDEVFMDVTDYLQTYHLRARELTMRIILDVLRTTGVTATAGIGTNLYLAKVAMDIGAKHIQPDKNGVRIAGLDERTYRRTLWAHRPITDFWRVGHGYARKLAEHGLLTMGDIARCSAGPPDHPHNEELLYKLFGVNAELLIDHAWGWEPCTIADIQAFKPENSSSGSNQVLPHPYTYDEAKLVVKEMADALANDLLRKKLVTDQVVLMIGYDIESLQNAEVKKKYHGVVTTDQYGRQIPKGVHSSRNLGRYTSSAMLITERSVELFEKIVNPDLLVRRIGLVDNRVLDENAIPEDEGNEQLDLFTDYKAVAAMKAEEDAKLAREKKRRQAILSISEKYGDGAILKGMNLEDGGRTVERNKQIGGHKK